MNDHRAAAIGNDTDRRRRSAYDHDHNGHRAGQNCLQYRAWRWQCRQGPGLLARPSTGSCWTTRYSRSWRRAYCRRPLSSSERRPRMPTIVSSTIRPAVRSLRCGRRWRCRTNAICATRHRPGADQRRFHRGIGAPVLGAPRMARPAMLHQRSEKSPPLRALFSNLDRSCCQDCRTIPPVDFRAGAGLGETPAFGYKRHLPRPNPGRSECQDLTSSPTVPPPGSSGRLEPGA